MIIVVINVMGVILQLMTVHYVLMQIGISMIVVIVLILIIMMGLIPYVNSVNIHV